MTRINHTFNGADFIGYGVMARGIDDGFHQIGVGTYQEDTGPICSAGLWSMPPTHLQRFKPEQRKYCLTMWEAMHLPITFTDNLHEYTTIFVPSEQNVELFSERHADVRFVPLGIDPVAWHYVPRRPVTDRFNFLTCGMKGRKGADIAIKAFTLAFPRERTYDIEPRLTVKAPVRWQDSVPDGVNVVDGIVPFPEMEAIYRNAHCYLGLSRGEGWGMQPMQAMAQGIPTILSDAHGHQAFSHLGVPIPCGESKADFFLYGTAGNWWEPELDAVVEAMRSVYENYSQYAEAARFSSRFVTQNFTWAHTATALMAEIGGSEPIETGEWVRPTTRKYLVRVNQKMESCIGGTTYRLVPGEDYYLQPDVRRVIQTAGLLDDSCLSDTTGQLGITEPEMDFEFA